MERKAVRGLSWTLLTYAGNRLVTLATTVILARLLVPEDFGLVSLAILAVGVFSLFGDLGFGGAFVLRQDLDDRGKGTVLTVMLAMSALVGLIVVAVSPLAARVFDEPRLTAVILALSPTLLLGGVTWFHDTLLQRELEFRRRFACRMLQTGLYASTALVLAALGAGVWSLVAGQLAGWAAYTAALVIVAPYRVRPRFDRVAARELLGTGSGFIVQGSLAFVTYNADYFAVGRMLGTTQVGHYTLASRLGELPYYAIADPVAKVTFPAFARMRHRGEDVSGAYCTALRAVALAACPLGILLSGAAEPLVELFFGSAWLPMIGPLAVLGIWGALRPMEATLSWYLNSTGLSGLMGRITAVLLVLHIPAVLLAASASGLTAVAWVMVANSAAGLVLAAVAAARRAGVPLARQWEAVRPVVIACAGAWGASRLVAEWASHVAAPGRFAASVAAGLTVYLALVSLIAPGVLRQALAFVGQSMRREAPAAPGPPTAPAAGQP
jgi:PST family polysaccharide transporter